MTPSPQPLELWGGIECTVARIGDRYRDQVAETGHREREDDIERIAALGIRTLRYPVLWETLAGDGADWTWHDRRLHRLRDLGITAIAGLIHHGSGPLDTDLLDPGFPRRLARHASRVARRYPWLTLYTPVNEPLTTARFSALYGHWYPHGRSYGAFLQALVNQCRATVLAMRAIRRFNPAAKLVVTDDFGKTFSTPPLAYQAEHENERRWLSFDLLFGRVDRHHPWWRILRDHGVSTRDLAILQGEPPPDIIGINHYLTSERFLDQRLSRYPEHLWGGNGRDRYADVEAVRVRLPDEELGPAARLREVWERYRTPIAVTEVHHGCTRDEQLRWLSEVWRAAETVRSEGADIRAVTVWALFGTTDWNTLLTREAGVYEAGAFDVRGPAPRRTAVGRAASDLARSGDFDHPVLDQPGWWRRDTRFYRPVRSTSLRRGGGRPRALLVLDDGGPLGLALARIATARGLDHVTLSARHIGQGMWNEQPHWAIVDLRSPAARGDVRRSFLGRMVENGSADRLRYLSVAPAVTAPGSGRFGTESDVPSMGFEQRAAAMFPEALFVRTGPLFGPWAPDPLVWAGLRSLASGTPPDIDPSAVLSPTYIPDLIHVALDLLIDGETGAWHLTNPTALSGCDLAQRLASRAGVPAPVLATRSPGAALGALTTERGQLMPPLDSALDRFMRDCEPDWSTAGTMSIAAE